MKSDERDSSPPEDELDQVGELMQACLACDGERQLPELERLCARHPEHSAELRRRFAFLRSAGFDADPGADAALPATFGDFETIERLASGGMGVVYRARQISLAREVALKLVRPELLFFEGARERFRREAETIARLEHPGIVPVYAAGEVRGVPYLAMQLVDGCTMAEALERVAGRAPESLRGSDLIEAVRSRRGVGGSLPAGFETDWARAIATVMRDISGALAHAHARGVVHRDVKPSNVLLDVDGRAQLIDFGLTGSESTDTLTRTGSQLGTLQYMAPERLHGGRGLDVRSDIYSVGVTLYELLALQAPFQAQTRSDLERLVLDSGVDPLRARNRRVDADLESICLQAMAVEPEQRYPDAQALAEDLDRWLAGQAVRARRPGRIERGSRWVRRHQPVAAALALSVLVVVGVPSLLYVLQRTHSRELSKRLEAERAALADMRVSNELITRVLRDASPAYGDGQQVTLYESLQKLAKLAEEGTDAPRARAQLLSMIGQIYFSRDDYASAERLLQLADERLQASGAGVGKERALVLESLGKLHKARGDMAEAREHYRLASRLATEAGLADDGWPERMLAQEAATYISTDKANAAKLLREALRTFHAKASDSDDRDWLKQNRLRLAQLEGALGDPAAGLKLLEEVRADIARQVNLSLRDRLELAAAESDLAFVAKDFGRAEQVLTEAVRVAREGTGERSSATASLLFQLGRVRFEQGAREEARANMEEALAIREALVGADAPVVKQLSETIERYFPGFRRK